MRVCKPRSGRAHPMGFDAGRLKFINWFPGHMATGLRQMRNHMMYESGVDLVVEVRDARCPRASQNDLLQEKNTKKSIVVYNKRDLAEDCPRAKALCSDGLLLSTKNPSDVHALLSTITQTISGQANYAVGRRYRALVVGIPNVGKSSLINAIRSASGHGTGRKAVVTGAKPGVTRIVSDVIKISTVPDIYLIDTPGIGWPKLANVHDGLNVALTGGLFDNAVGVMLLAEYLHHVLQARGSLASAIAFSSHPDFQVFIGQVAKGIGALKPGAVPDLERAAAFLLKQFRSGRLGRYTLD